jgi:uncharacterized protein YecE (DUF72 family)
MDRLQTPPIVTSDFVYLRLIGDRRLSDDQFGKLQTDRTEEIRNWANKMKEVKQIDKDAKVGLVATSFSRNFFYIYPILRSIVSI